MAPPPIITTSFSIVSCAVGEGPRAATSIGRLLKTRMDFCNVGVNILIVLSGDISCKSTRPDSVVSPFEVYDEDRRDEKSAPHFVNAG